LSLDNGTSTPFRTSKAYEVFDEVFVEDFEFNPACIGMAAWVEERARLNTFGLRSPWPSKRATRWRRLFYVRLGATRWATCRLYLAQQVK
jgi:hypothetical protein